MQKLETEHLLDESFTNRTTASGLRILITGDSYVQGTSGPKEDSLAYLIAKKLQERLPIQHLRIYAKDGATVSEIATNLHTQYPASNPDEPKAEPKFDIIISNGGVNDQYRGHVGALYQDALNKKLFPTVERLLADDGHFFKVSTPIWALSPAGITPDSPGYSYRTDQKEGYELVRQKVTGHPSYNSPQGVADDTASINTADRIHITKLNSPKYHSVDITEVTARAVYNFVATDALEDVHYNRLDATKLNKGGFVDHIHFSRAVHEAQADVIVAQILEQFKGVEKPEAQKDILLCSDNGRVKS